jgi:PKD repeat protein
MDPQRRFRFVRMSVVAITALVTVLTLSIPGSTSRAADTGNAAPQTGRIVSEDPASFTPHVMDGAVISMTRVANMIIVGGTFTRVRNNGSSTDILRRNVFAFDATTGIVSTTFAPNPNDTVYKVQAAADGTSVYVGGNFTSITSGGVAVSVSRLFRARVSDGSRITTFQSGTINGQVRDISVTGNRLWISGKFTHVAGVAQRALATLNATTGVRDPYFNGVIAGVHNGGTTNVLQIATDPSNSRLVAIGNFDTVNGVKRHQFAVIDIGGPTYQLANFYTTLFESSCSGNFETYLTDVEYSPDGSFFAVSTTGAYGGGTESNAGTSGCDVVARFETGSSGTSVQPTWTAYTGGDTTWSVEITDNVVYVGGHQRWQNNPSAGDRIGGGAVSREGIAALNPVNGMPYSWNPTRTRGVGVKDMIATESGLFVGSDTEVFGGETHRRVAYVPLSSGEVLPTATPYSLPGQVFRVATSSSQLLRRDFDGTQATGGGNAPGSGWGSAVGAFMVNGWLYTGFSDGSFTKRTFDGQTYGPTIAVDAADQLALQETWHNIDVPSITSLFYVNGYIYFTRSGQNSLYRRGFEVESDIVGQQRFATVAPNGINYSTMRGAFAVGNKLYFATTGGSLYAANWNGSGPVANSAQVLTGAGGGWSSRAMFLFQGDQNEPPADLPPAAAFSVSCQLLTCTFDASASEDPDGSISTYRWDFGDGETATTSNPVREHTYAAAGSVSVTLTVTDDDGLQDSVVRTADPDDTANPVTFVAASSTSGNRTSHSVTVPATAQPGDLLVLYFVSNSTGSTYGMPAGWSQIETESGDNTVGRALTKIASSSDPGSVVTVTSSSLVKDVTAVAVYRGADQVTPIAASASTLETASSFSHGTPQVTASDSQQWLLSFWSDKSSSTTSWTLPATTLSRSSAFGTGSGRISAVVADSNGPVGTGPRGGLTATANGESSSAVMFSILVNPS